MEELLRFVGMRPPQVEENPLIIRVPSIDGHFPDTLKRLIRENALPQDVLDFIRDYLESTSAEDPSKLPLYAELTSFGELIEQEEFISVSGISGLVTSAFNQTHSNLIQTPEWSEMYLKLIKAIIALTNLPSYRPSLLAEYTNLYILVFLIKPVGNFRDVFPYEGKRPKTILNSVIEIPKEYLVNHLYGKITSIPYEKESVEEERQKRIQEIRNEIDAHSWALTELNALSSYDFETVNTNGHESEGGSQPGNIAMASGQPESTETTSAVVIRHDTINNLSNSTRNVVSSLVYDSTAVPYDVILNRINFRMLSLKRELLMLEQPQPRNRVTRVGGINLVDTVDTHSYMTGSLDFVDESYNLGLYKPSAIGTLYVAKQQIKRYEGGEISHVENILNREIRLRDTRRLRRTEEILTIEEETTTEEERDLQSTERLEMSKEVSNTIKEDEKFKIGGSLSAGYGPYFQVSINTEYETSTSKETSNKMAHNYSKEITERAASKITERIRREQVTKILEEFEEKNKHGFDNTGEGSSHITGIYQWLNKVYEVQVYDYGVRLFFDIMLPEPALFYLNVIRELEKDALESVPPTFTDLDGNDLSPSSIDEDNYKDLTARFKASGVEPPPGNISVSTTFDFKSSDSEIAYVKSRSINIPEGYYTKEARMHAFVVGKAAAQLSEEVPPEEEGGVPGGIFPSPGLRILVGSQSAKVAPDPPTDPSPVTIDVAEKTFESLPLFRNVGSIPVAVGIGTVGGAAMVTIDIVCTRTKRAYEAWQMKTYDALLSAHQKLQSEYEEKVAEQEARQGVHIKGSNPLENRKIERRELKRLAVSILTQRNYNWFSVVTNRRAGSGRKYPEIIFDRLNEDDSYHIKLIRLFETAFEWDKMYYEFYPYFWDDRGKWYERNQNKDVSDSQFTEFLNASWCFVRIPVTPEFEGPVLHFLDTKGDIWEGGDYTGVLSPDYWKWLKSIREAREEEEEEEEEETEGPASPLGDVFPEEGKLVEGARWEVKLPTSLVKLRTAPWDTKLPQWEYNEDDGIWWPDELVPQENDQ